MRSELATILITHHQLLDNWLDKVLNLLPNKNLETQIFFVDTGTQLVGQKLANIPFVKLVYCAHSHRVLKGPKPLDSVEAGGLLDLGKMVGKSHYFLSVPQTFKPIKPIAKTNKDIGLVLNDNSKLAVEGLRVATGLAGCNHRLTIFCPNNFMPFIKNPAMAPQEAKPYLEVLTQLGAKFQTLKPSDYYTESDFIIGV